MNRLRNAHLLVRILVAWFALSLSAAIASPLIKPQAVEMICSGSGMVMLKVGDDGTAKSLTPGSLLDCPLCLGWYAPPPFQQAVQVPSMATPHALRAIPAARIAALTAAPPPARGPPHSA